MLKCEECDASVKNHKWGKMLGRSWFFGKDGKSYCPEHLPEWVDEWRRKKSTGSEGR